MASISITELGGVLPTLSLNFGWMKPGKARVIQRQIQNESYTDNVYQLAIKTVRDSKNSVLVDSGAFQMRFYGDNEWITMLNDYFVIGDLTPRESKIIEIRMAIPLGITDRGKFYIGLLMRYL